MITGDVGMDESGVNPFAITRSFGSFEQVAAGTSNKPDVCRCFLIRMYWLYGHPVQLSSVGGQIRTQQGGLGND